MPKRIPTGLETTDLFDHSHLQNEAKSRFRTNPQNVQIEGKSLAHPDTTGPYGSILAPADERYLSDKQVAERFGVSRPTIWRWVKTEKAFPHPVSLSSGTSRWRLSDLFSLRSKVREGRS
ncbi:helix-turn-helix transcriptional regulator [Parasedimentitalea huanghaiensis]|uniref:AlpA family phage regulatory protein n=1 Tax=Parasedimentitalea huanghaiensis TaxID=2682100 RepID=A0A6L6WFR3_9RHOB|nr:helix-turn-helix domain-containing protein [Zongyanglinia huanghaiensis]MVO14522.1 AlpA family phage regulatory protein [Zongyanglinia huanghaiensis]